MTAGAPPALEMLRLRSLSMGCVSAGDRAAPPVLMLHGFPECHLSWRHQMFALADAGFRVIVPDQRGYNRTDKHGPFTLRRLTADIAELLDCLQIDACHVVGHDWGGVVSYEFAHRFAARVRSLSILNAPHLNAWLDHLRGPQRAAQMRKSRYILQFQLPFLPERAFVRDGAALAERLFAGVRGITPADIDAYKRAWLQPGAIGAMIGWYRALARQVLVWGFRPPMRVLPHRAQLLWGTHDRALEFAINDTLARYVPAVEIHRIDGASHFVQMDAPAEVNARLIAFLSRDR